MNRAAIAFGLAGFAAAGAVSTLVQAPGAPAGEMRSAKVKCSAGNHPGQAVELNAYLKVNGQRLKGSKSIYLRNGDGVKTTSRGAAKVCLRRGGTECDLDAGTVLNVLPKNKVALGIVKAGNVTCKISGGDEREFDTTDHTIKLAALESTSGLAGRRPANRGGTSATAAGAGHLFSITVRNRRAVVKVGRGATVVARRGNLESGVVVGRRKQVIVPKGRDPNRPATLKLTGKEQRVFGQLAGLLPPVQDKTAPAAGIVTTPSDPSSLRTPKFSFAAGEASIFSCSVDGSVPRLCSNPQRFRDLGPGRHTLAVTATDPTGNVGSAATFEWTIDASRIAFTSERDGNKEIYVMEPDGTHPARLTSNPTVDEDPVWSPDGRRIAFHSDRDKNLEIYVMNADGSNQVRLTNNRAFDRNPTWSPDGRMIAFETARDGNSEIYAMNADGSSPHRLTFSDSADFDPAWSPNGAQVAFASNRDGNDEIYVMNADGTNPVRLTDDRAIEFNPAWSPNGEQIAFHSDRGPPRESSQIFVMNRDGSNVKRITFTRAADYNPVWAPDGAEIAFQSNRDGNDNIYIVNADGSDEELLRLTDAPQADLVPDWSRPQASATQQAAAPTRGSFFKAFRRIVSR